MRKRCVLSILLASFAVPSHSSEMEIDGSSPAAFERSHAALLASLSPEDRMRLSLAELIVLARKGCLARKPDSGQPILDTVPGGQADLGACRKELHGLSFKDIMALAYPQEAPAAGGAADVP